MIGPRPEAPGPYADKEIFAPQALAYPHSAVIRATHPARCHSPKMGPALWLGNYTSARQQALKSFPRTAGGGGVNKS